MTINNVMNESVYLDKTITAKRIYREYNENLNRKFGIDITPIVGGKQTILEFNSDYYKFVDKGNFNIIRIPSNDNMKEYLKKLIKNETKLNKIFDLYENKLKNIGFDISKYFNNKKVQIYFKNENNKNKGDAYINNDKNGVIITIYLKMIEDEKDLITTIQHEITHTQDYIRAKFKLNNKVEKKYDSEHANYIGDIYEFNRYINMISNKQKRSLKVREDLKKIKNANDLKEFLKTSATTESYQAFINNPDLFKRLIKRLHREKIVNFEGTKE